MYDSFCHMLQSIWWRQLIRPN